MPLIFDIILWLLVLFFVVGGVANVVGPARLREDYRRWGYPSGFRFVTGALELTAAILIAVTVLRCAGLILGAVIMVAAAGTLVWRREWGHLPPALIALLAIAGVWLWFY